MDLKSLSVLIVEDDLVFGKMLQAWFERNGHSTDVALKASDAKKLMTTKTYQIAICDLRLPGEDGLSVLAWIKSNFPKTIVVMMTGYADVQSAVSAIKLGAYDYISKPFTPDNLFSKISDAVKQFLKDEDDENEDLEQNKTVVNSKFIKGNSPLYDELYNHVNLVAPTPLSVLIKGESGVGKEHIARLIHEGSKVSEGPFIAVDCGVLSRELAASDLFGHVKGAFTGALSDKTGFFTRAHKGTLFLDEIGNLPIDVQIQLLRALQEKRVKPVGGDKEIKVDVRVVAATNEDIEFAAEHGYFRSDLYHRITEFILEVPSLRECREDIPLYLDFFLQQANKSLKKRIAGFTNEAIEVLTNYDWPGNIREMRNIVNRLTLLETDKTISAGTIPSHFKTKKEEEKRENLEIEHEKEKITEILKITNNNIIKTATLLDVDMRILFEKIKLYNIEYAQNG